MQVRETECAVYEQDAAHIKSYSHQLDGKTHCNNMKLLSQSESAKARSAADCVSGLPDTWLQNIVQMDSDWKDAASCYIQSSDWKLAVSMYEEHSLVHEALAVCRKHGCLVVFANIAFDVFVSINDDDRRWSYWRGTICSTRASMCSHSSSCAMWTTGTTRNTEAIRRST